MNNPLTKTAELPDGVAMRIEMVEVEADPKRLPALQSELRSLERLQRRHNRRPETLAEFLSELGVDPDSDDGQRLSRNWPARRAVRARNLADRIEMMKRHIAATSPRTIRTIDIPEKENG